MFAHPIRAGLVVGAGARKPRLDGGTRGARKLSPVRWEPGESEVSPVMGVLGEQERSPNWRYNGQTLCRGFHRGRHAPLARL